MGMQTFNILRLNRKPSGPVIAYVKSDFEDADLKTLGSNLRHISRSEEYAVFTLADRTGRDLTFMGTGSGAASLLTGLFELLSPDLSAVVRIGACGGLNETKVGQIIVCNSSLCMDRVSSQLAGGKRALPDRELSTKIEQTMLGNGITVKTSSNVSVDAMYLFEPRLRQAEREGVSCWDLETATLLAFGEKFRVKAASVLEVVSDRSGNSMESYPPIRRLDYVRAVMDAAV
jgi:uridine phosphorylase